MKLFITRNVTNIKKQIKPVLMLSCLCLFFSFYWITPAQANEAQMKATLVRITHQLQAIKPLIIQAEKEQSANPRVKIHFDRFQDVNGHWHNGLRQDIDNIQNSLVRIINQESVEPRIYHPIQDDFIGDHNDE